jgi:hypothetical protein
MWAVRERGVAALKERANIERLSRCDAAARTEINRLIASLIAASPMTEVTARDLCGEALASAGIEPKPNGGSTKERDDRNGKPASGPQSDASDQNGTSWPTMDEAAYYGLAGDIERTIAPHTEADSAAILIQFLVYFGNVIGNSPYYLVEADKHHTTRHSQEPARISRLLGISPKTNFGRALLARTWRTGLQIAFYSPAFVVQSCCLMAAIWTRPKSKCSASASRVWSRSQRQQVDWG